MARTIKIEIIGDPSSAIRAFKKAGGAADSFHAKMGRATTGLAKGAATAGIAGGAFAVAIGIKAVQAASSLGEQVNKTSVVFGKSAGPIQKWAKTTATAIGISNREALQAAGIFGNMLVPMGFARKDAAKMSKRFVRLASDMASFNDADPSEVLDALRSGLAGETEPLRRFGVFLNDARLKQVALNMGIYKGKGPLDATAKAAATFAVILKDTSDAQGDYNRTAGSWPNLMRAIRAQVEDLKAALGKGLLPVVQKAGIQLKAFLADPELKQRVTALGRIIGQNLLAAIRAIGKWFRENWEGIKSAFRTGAELALKLASAARGIANAFRGIASVTPGGGGTVMGAILGGVMVAKLAGVLASVKLLRTRLMLLRATPWLIPISLILMNKDAIDDWVKQKVGRFYGGGTFDGTQEGFKKLPKEIQQRFRDKGYKPPRNAKRGKKAMMGGGFAPGRALGGPALAGKTYRVGERGAEMLTMGRSSGHISANGGGGVTINGNVVLPGVTDAKQFLKEIQRIGNTTAASRRGRFGGSKLALG